jgi:Mce-associated membrane protein
MTRTNVINAVLAVLLLALIGWLLVFAFKGAVAAPGSTPAEEKAQEYSDVARAASEATVAFLTVDHERMDELTEKVLSVATADFKKEYQSSVKSLTDAAVSQESVSTGSVDEVGLGEIDSDSASVFVAAASKVKNKGTKGEVEDRTWRMKLTMAKEGDRWLVSKLEFVG